MSRRLSENASRFTIEDIPFAAAPSAFPGRSAFAGQDAIIREIDEEDEEEDEEQENVSDNYVHSLVAIMLTFFACQAVRFQRDVANVESQSDKKAKINVSFFDLLKLNKQEWFPLTVGIIGSAIMGAIFPLMSLVFSEVLAVSYQLPRVDYIHRTVFVYCNIVMMCAYRYDTIIIIYSIGSRTSKC